MISFILKVNNVFSITNQFSLTFTSSSQDLYFGKELSKMSTCLYDSSCTYWICLEYFLNKKLLISLYRSKESPIPPVNTGSGKILAKNPANTVIKYTCVSTFLPSINCLHFQAQSNFALHSSCYQFIWAFVLLSFWLLLLLWQTTCTESSWLTESLIPRLEHLLIWTITHSRSNA